MSRRVAATFANAATLPMPLVAAGDWPTPCNLGTTMAEDSCEVWIHRWRCAMRWRRRVEAELRPLGLTLAQWLVLDAIAALIRETADAVSQVQVARRLEMDKATLSRMMDVLVRRQLIDRGISYPDAGYRIYLTDRGRGAAAQGRARLGTASAKEATLLSQNG